jgi:hypothetical protein
MAEIDPDGAETRFPGRKRQPKQRGHLTDTGVYYELHFDGHEKLNFKALRMGPVGIDIYGSRCHSSSQMVKFMAVPNARCSSTVGHYYLDLVEKHGGMSPDCLLQTSFQFLFSFRPGHSGWGVRNRRTIRLPCCYAVGVLFCLVFH